ncbi:hypothetical protein VTK56DRAFT_4654 [Thermocarpiscus australiensis]
MPSNTATIFGERRAEAILGEQPPWVQNPGRITDPPAYIGAEPAEQQNANAIIHGRDASAHRSAVYPIPPEPTTGPISKAQDHSAHNPAPWSGPSSIFAPPNTPTHIAARPYNSPPVAADTLMQYRHQLRSPCPNQIWYQGPISQGPSFFPPPDPWLGDDPLPPLPPPILFAPTQVSVLQYNWHPAAEQSRGHIWHSWKGDLRSEADLEGNLEGEEELRILGEDMVNKLVGED